MGAPASSPLTGIVLGAAAGGAVLASGGAAVPALLAASTALAATGAVQAGMAQKQQADYQAEVAEQNAIRARNAADEARIRGEITEQQHRLRVNQAVGQFRTAAAARGVLVDEGSALDLTTDIQAVGELDAQMIRRNTDLEVRARGDQVNQLLSESDLTRAAGRDAATAGAINAGSTILSGSATVADKWYNTKPRTQ